MKKVIYIYIYISQKGNVHIFTSAKFNEPYIDPAPQPIRQTNNSTTSASTIYI